jgi:hypothetical protein
MLYLQQNFDYTRYTSGQFQMSDVAFHGTNPTPGRPQGIVPTGVVGVGY